MKSDFGVMVVAKVGRAVKSCQRQSVPENAPNSAEVLAFVCFLQLFCIVTSREVQSSVSILLLFTTYVCSEIYRIIAKSSDFDRKDYIYLSSGTVPWQMNVFHSEVKMDASWKLMKLHSLHKCPEKTMDLLWRYCFRGRPATTNCDGIFESYSAIVSYIANPSKSRDILANKYSAKAWVLCLGYIAGKDTFKKYTSVRLCDVEQVESLKKNLIGKRRTESLFAIGTLSMHVTLPALFGFPFIDALLSNKTYPIFS